MGPFSKHVIGLVLPSTLNKMDITSYLISIGVNSTLYDEVNAPIQISLECQHKNGHFFKMSYLEQRQSHTQID